MARVKKKVTRKKVTKRKKKVERKATAPVKARGATRGTYALGFMVEALAKPKGLTLDIALDITRGYRSAFLANKKRPLSDAQVKELNSVLSKKIGKSSSTIANWAKELERAGKQGFSLHDYFRKGRPCSAVGKMNKKLA